LLHNDYLALRVWCGLTLVTGLGPPLIAGFSELAHRFASRRSLVATTTFRGRVRAAAVVPVAHVWCSDGTEGSTVDDRLSVYLRLVDSATEASGIGVAAPGAANSGAAAAGVAVSGAAVSGAVSGAAVSGAAVSGAARGVARAIGPREVAAREAAARRLSARALSARALAERRLAERRLAERRLAERRLAERRLAAGDER
jgi:hypothetical protein